MTIPAAPTTPDRGDSETFPDRADAFVEWMANDLVPAFNADIAAMNLNDTTDTSTSSVAIGSGSKSFTVSASKSFVGGMWLLLADTAAPSTNSMVAQVTSYDSGTGALVVNVPTNGVFGSGTKTAWTISLTAAPSTQIAAHFVSVAGAADMAASRTALDVPSNAQMTSAIGAIQTMPSGAIAPFAMSKAPTGWLKADGTAVSRTTYAALFAALVESSVVTMTIATPGVVTWTAHGRSANDPVKFSTTGALPTGFVAGTTYYVVGASITTNTFQLSATAGGAAINTTGTQSGVHTGIHAPFGTGDGSTTFNVPDLRAEFVRGLDGGRAIDTNRAMGSAQADELASHRHGFSQQIVTLGANGVMGPAGGATYYSGYTGGSETRPRNIAMLYCIKT